MLVSIVIDSVYFTRHWVQYCHPSLICKRKSHAYAFFQSCLKQKVLRKSRDFGLTGFVLFYFWKREQDSPLSRLQTWKHGSMNLQWNSHHWPTSSFLWVFESIAECKCLYLTWPCTLVDTVSWWCKHFVLHGRNQTKVNVLNELQNVLCLSAHQEGEHWWSSSNVIDFCLSQEERAAQLYTLHGQCAGEQSAGLWHHLSCVVK